MWRLAGYLALMAFPLVADDATVPVFPDNFHRDQVLVQLREGAGNQQKWPQPLPPVTESWNHDVALLLQLPHRYDDWAIRVDREVAVMLQLFLETELPAGTHRVLVRARGGSRLWIDDALVTGTRYAVFRGDGHSPVESIPEPPAPGCTRPSLGDGEATAEITSRGGMHRFVLESLVGSKTMRPETGTLLAAVQLHRRGPFVVLSPDMATNPRALTESAWPAIAAANEQSLAALDTARRKTAMARLAEYWQARHIKARAFALAHPVQVPPAQAQWPAGNEIDRFLLAKRDAAETLAAVPEAAGSVSYERDIQPILADRCLRCHAEKKKGGLRLDRREAALRAGDSGSAAIIPHRPTQSHLVARIRSSDEDVRMPPQGEPLTPKQVQLIETWIAEGASWSARPPPPPPVPPPLDDLAFVRRIFFDTVGLPPSPAEIDSFLHDAAPDKSTRLIDRLLTDPRAAGHGVAYWQDVLAENPNILKPEMNNTGPFRFWIHEALLDGRPMDRFVTELVLMRGSRMGGGTAGFGMATQNDVPAAEKANVLANAFLGVEMKCARCHDAPYHRSTQQQLFGMAALLEQKPLTVPATSSVPAAFFEKTKSRQPLIRATLATGSRVEGAWPFSDLSPAPEPSPLLENATARDRLAWHLTHPQNTRFAEVLANRAWKRLFGTGLIEPVHDWEGRAASHPELLAWLGRVLMENGFDLRRLDRTIMQSAAYRRRATGSATGDPAQRFCLAPLPRRLSAEQVVDSLNALAGPVMDPEALTFDIDSSQKADTHLNLGVPQRAWEYTSLANERDRPALALPRAQAVTDVLEAFGWRASRPEPLTDRAAGGHVLQPAIMANGVLTATALRLSDANALTAVVCAEVPLDRLIEDLWLRVLTRMPSAAERAAAAELLAPGYDERLTGHAPAAPSNDDLDVRYRRIAWSNHLRPEATEIKQRVERAVRRGPAPTLRLATAWRERCEDLLWSMVNSPEFISVP